MCIRCENQRKPKKGKPSQDELWELYETAYAEFQTQFVTGRKTYHRYVTDFISFNLLIDSSDISSWKQHTMNINSMFDLLANRKDLVLKYFSQEGLTRHEFKKLQHEFNTTETVAEESNDYGAMADFMPTSLSYFNDIQLSLIADMVNEAHLFVGDVSMEDMELFFSCSLDRPLQVSNNGLAALFLDCLRSEHLISHNWQKVIADYQLLCSYKTKKVLKRTDISTSLSEYRNRHPQTQKAFANFARKLKSMKEKEE